VTYTTAQVCHLGACVLLAALNGLALLWSFLCEGQVLSPDAFARQQQGAFQRGGLGRGGGEAPRGRRGATAGASAAARRRRTLQPSTSAAKAAAAAKAAKAAKQRSMDPELYKEPLLPLGEEGDVHSADADDYADADADDYDGGGWDGGGFEGSGRRSHALPSGPRRDPRDSAMEDAGACGGGQGGGARMAEEHSGAGMAAGMAAQLLASKAHALATAEVRR
jgi:hypothetical protein